MQTLSSAMTFFYKFVFFPLWSGAFGLGTVVAFASDKPETEGARWIFAAAWIAGSGFMWWAVARLKRVQLDGNMLVISNYLDTISVPVHLVADVQQNMWLNLRPIKITFRSDTPFGQSIMFMPPTSFRLFTKDPIVHKLRKMAESGTVSG